MPRTYIVCNACTTASVTSCVVAEPPKSGVTRAAACRYRFHGTHDEFSRFVLAQIIQHHGACPDSRQRIGNVLAMNIRRGAVHRLEHARVTPGGIDIGAGRQPQTPLQRAAKVGEDIGKEIRGDHYVE